MCTVTLLRRPDHDWPLLLAANRDEMGQRPSRPPGRHWPDRAHVTAGLDEMAGGTWLGVNDYGLVAGILNRLNTLGPEAGKRSRGELPLEALDHAEAVAAAAAMSEIDPEAYRPFNMVIADALDAFWVANTGAMVTVRPIDDGLHMVTAYDLDDLSSPRMGHYLPKFRAAQIPDPDSNDWTDWQALLRSIETGAEGTPGSAMNVRTSTGFGTVSSSLIALPAIGRTKVRKQWLYSGHPIEENPYRQVPI